ncbi:RagB/SusD family nutrient uptake outer membrane protein [Microbacter margulisiae]|uniref:Starch-binding associating with outer membrane n=1 Tax=Microbacter margulisiae TaxID=1350067 RepID=A0A7W5DP79_9PORP|nr:RagB/SusD family nutrient uptake outer membrane protein [Microbacter margulisiae]MBB3186554.1 hypothetical protein [Microbacter margulisiae]
MRQIFKSAIIVSIFILSFTSCSNYLNTAPGNQYDDATVWQNSTLVEEFVDNIYLGIPYPYQWYMNASLTDEAIPVQYDGVVGVVLTGTMTPDNKGAFDNNWANCMENYWWNSCYNNIRECNLFFEKINQTPFADQNRKSQITGEVHFLRAYFYYLLFIQYGGVPLIDKTYNIGDNYSIKRNTLAETVTFIVNDLDKADSLIGDQSDKTRATKGSILALKSRVLLYAASDLFNSKANWAPGYAHPELVSYMDDNRQQRWQAAKDAAKAVMDLNQYSLYNDGSDPTTNFENLFLSMDNNEQIFIAKYDKINYPFYGTDWISSVCGTPSFGGFGLNQVTANLADAFENADGTPFNWATQSADPYVHRDPRFYATILYNGAPWVAMDWNSWSFVSHSVQTGTWASGATGSDFKSGEFTGYYIRKFIDPSFFTYYYGPRQPQPYVQIRYAEILLNYAEACIALGEEDEARRVINLIRERAGMPDITDSGTQLVAKYRNERRVELAWESQRFFDVRRWMIASQAYQPALGVQVTYPTDGSTADPVYKEVQVENRAWTNSQYLIPISRSEMQANPALIQNPGYN